MDDPPGACSNARANGVRCRFGSELPAQVDAHRLKFADVAAEGQVECVERKDWVTRDLAGTVQHHPTAASDPLDGPASGQESIRAQSHVSNTPLTPDGDAALVIADHKRSHLAVARYVVNQAALECVQGAKIQTPEQVDREGSRGGKGILSVQATHANISFVSKLHPATLFYHLRALSPTRSDRASALFPSATPT
jgi:hypothetical protein